MGARLSVCCLAWMSALACTSSTSSRPATAARVAPSAEPVSAPEEVETPAEAPTEALVVGWASDPNGATRDALQLNEAALKLHAEGDYQGALDGFARAAEASPHYAWPHYNRACALSRLGQTRAAAVELERLLLEDLPTFRTRWRDDPDLEPLRESAVGKALQRRMPEIEAAYGAALQRGVPAFVYRKREGWKEGTSRKPLVPYRDLRIGIYDLQTQRFVPMVPKLDRAYSGLLDRRRKRAIVATGALAMEDMWEVQPERARAKVYSLDAFGEVVFESARLDARDVVFYGLKLRLAPDDEALYAELIGLHYAPQRNYTLVGARRLKDLGYEHDDMPDTHPPAEHDPTASHLSIVEMAEAVYDPTTAVRVRRRKVFVEGVADPLKLGPGHHTQAQVYPSPKASIFVVVSDTTRFSDDGASTEDEVDPQARDVHVVDLVDTDAKTVTRLSGGKGIVHVKWAPDGTLMLETREGARRYPPGELSYERDVPAWVHFGTPPFPEEGGV